MLVAIIVLVKQLKKLVGAPQKIVDEPLPRRINSMFPVGGEPIEISHHPVQHVLESCSGPGHSFLNVYGLGDVPNNCQGTWLDFLRSDEPQS
jgi:hypothetical protein